MGTSRNQRVCRGLYWAGFCVPSMTCFYDSICSDGYIVAWIFNAIVVGAPFCVIDVGHLSSTR